MKKEYESPEIELSFSLFHLMFATADLAGRNKKTKSMDLDMDMKGVIVNYA